MNTSGEPRRAIPEPAEPRRPGACAIRLVLSAAVAAFTPEDPIEPLRDP